MSDFVKCSDAIEGKSSVRISKHYLYDLLVISPKRDYGQDIISAVICRVIM